MPTTTYSVTPHIKLRLGIVSTNHDGLIDTLRDHAYAFINSQLGFVYNPQTSTTRKFHAENDVRGKRLDLVCGYVHTLTSVLNGDGTTITSGQYIVVQNRILHLKQNLGLRWNWSAKDDPADAIEITGKFGLGTSVPEDVTDLEQNLVGFLYRALDTTIPLEISMVTAQNILLLPSSLPPYVVMMLERLRPII